MKKKLRIGINGFGRIGRNATRIIMEKDNLEVVAVNSRANASSHAYLLKYDSTYRTYEKDVRAQKDAIVVDNKTIHVLKYDNPADIPWDEYKVDLVIDSTGIFRETRLLQKHLKKGVKQVLLSAPAKDKTKTIVMGINEKTFNPKTDNIVSNSSCTTNCLSTTLKVLHDDFNVQHGFMTTVHAVTDSQNLLDNSHKKSPRLRRAAFASMIPSTTGSAVDVGKLFPNLDGKIICQSLRIPLLTVSLVNLVVKLQKKATEEKINSAYKKASKSYLKGILAVAKEELVSSDYIGSSFSSIIDPFFTKVVKGDLVNIYAWYDNEWGYTTRLVDLVEFVAKKRRLI